MKTNDLKILAGMVVTESKLGKQTKLQILEWLQNEASKVQVMGFLLDGRIQYFNEETQKVVVDRFNVSEAGGRVAKLRKSFMSRAGSATLATAAIWGIYRAIRANFDKCTKQCGTFELNTSRRQHCMLKCKVQKLKGELAAAQKEKDLKKIEKAKLALAKAQAAMTKSIASFKARGAQE